MKTQTFGWALPAFVAVIVLSHGMSFVAAQDSPEIEAFIAGIDDFEDSGYEAPDVRVGDNEIPDNLLPDADTNEFVAVPEPVRPATTDAGVATQGSDTGTAVSPPAPGDDYFKDYNNPVLDAPVNRTWVLGINVPIFDREFDGDRLFSFNPSDLTQTLSSDNADPNGTSGIDINLARRSSTGWGFEARYWGLYSSAATQVLGASPTTAISGLSQINDLGTSVADTFNASDFHALTRDYSFNNVELNLLRNGYTFAPLGRGLMIEWLNGLRFMQFDESLEYAAVSSTNSVIRSALNSSVQNSMFGFQTGGRAEWAVLDRTSFTLGGKLGLFNNHAQKNIVATNGFADLTFRRPVISTGPNTGAEFEFGDSKNDLAVMGELDLGLVYQWNMRTRLRLGYRALGVMGIADSEKNIPHDFTDVTELTSTNTDGDLVLRGGYVGVEIGF